MEELALPLVCCEVAHLPPLPLPLAAVERVSLRVMRTSEHLHLHWLQHSGEQALNLSGQHSRTGPGGGVEAAVQVSQLRGCEPRRAGHAMR